MPTLRRWKQAAGSTERTKMPGTLCDSRHLFQFSVLSSALRIMEVIMAICFGVAYQYNLTIA